MGVVIFILVRHLGEVPAYPEAHVKEEKKRWWQIFLGKGEGFLRMLRSFILSIDDKLNDSIKTVRERKNDIGRSLKDFREKKRQQPAERVENFSSQNLERREPKIEVSSDINSQEESPAPVKEEAKSYPLGVVSEEFSVSKEKLSREASPDMVNLPPEIKSTPPVKKPIRFKFPFPKETIPVQEIVKKTFTADELKNERKEYWKKKEAMLIQSIVREPKNVNLFLQLGRLYCNQKNWIDAKNAFYEVLKLDKMNIKAKEELKRIEKNENKD